MLLKGIVKWKDRILMQIAADQNLIIHQMDVKTAYLNAEIDTDIYLQQPEGYEIRAEDGSELVFRLNRSIYGLKQSGRNWNQLLHSFLEKNGFKRNPVDYCVYTKHDQDGLSIVIIWADDILIAASNRDILAQFKEMMKGEFKMKDFGEISYFLSITFDQRPNEISMDQTRFITNLLEKFSMSACKPRSTPCEQKPGDFDNKEEVNPDRYREIIGSLLYLALGTRPDIAWVVSKLSQCLDDPKGEDFVTAKHVLRYLKGTISYKLTYRKSIEEPLSLLAYSDSDWANSEDGRGTTGYCFSLGKHGALVSWKTTKQPTVALSSCEAEYMGLGATTQEALYLMQFLNGIDKERFKCTSIMEDNQGAIALSKNPVQRQRSKHIDIRYHFIRSVLEQGKINLKYCPTEDMVTDVFIKPPTKFKLQRFRSFLFGNY